MTTQKNTNINFDTKSQLAKLIATENITIQHNNVKTASFDTVNRVLTLPIFKVQSGDVYDMLIAHECSHALYTPTDGWKSIADDKELRSYVNVLEDTRIDRLIQAKYPGVVKNYLNGFDIMEKQGFFGTKGRDINKDFMLIDKVNLRSKSSNRLPFIFSTEDKAWLKKVDNLKSFDDVVKLAKQMLNWQKKQIESMKMLPEFDSHPITKNYDLNGDEELDSETGSQEIDGDNQPTEGDGQEQEGSGDKQEEKDDKSNDDTKDIESNSFNSNGAGGKAGVEKDKIIAVTEKIFEAEKQKMTDDSTSYSYFNLPEANLKNVIVSSKDWVSTWKKYQFKDMGGVARYEYINWLKDDYKKFKNDNKKTVMYLVKEFEMKKSATAYKRASTDKTGIIDPLKLPSYKYSDDIFKRLTILPNAKNHGMMMLLDWSGSMCDVIKQTIEQLMNLVWFCQKINIPYEVYLFTSELDGSCFKSKYEYDANGDKINIKSPSWNYKHGDGVFGDFNLINIASHRMKKTELDESLMYLHHTGLYYSERYSRNYWNDSLSYKGDRFGVPNQYGLGTTPLNEALVVMNKLVPLYKKKYNIEKMTFITLTDGSSNSNYGCDVVKNDGKTLRVKHSSSSNPIITVGRKQYKSSDRYYGRMTNMLLNVLQNEHGINTVGFYVVKRLNRMWELESYIGDYKDWNHKQELLSKLKKNWSKDKMVDVKKDGYNRYFILNGKQMGVENTDLSDVKDDMKAGKIKQIFSKSMKGRIVSRSLLNKFIEEVA